MKEIQLTKGQVAIVDDEDFEKVNKFKWQAAFKPDANKFYAKRTRQKDNKHIFMHRFIMNSQDGFLCDHINGNTLDNRKSNLRHCNYSENQMNRKVLPNNKLGLKGIFKRKDKQRSECYIVKIHKKGMKSYQKRFYKLEEAINARDEVYKIYHGEFARTE